MTENNSPNEFGGIFAVIDDDEAARQTFFGLYALQHRGQESAGITVFNGQSEGATKKALGLVSEVFSEDDLSALKGRAALGQVRAAGGPGNSTRQIQPKAIIIGGHTLALVLNGRLTNSQALKERLEAMGSIIHSGSDAELILQVLARHLSRFPFNKWRTVAPAEKARLLTEALARALTYESSDIPRPEGIYSMVLMADGVMLAMRDPLGLRPLCYGRMMTGGLTVASETCAFDLVEAKYIGEVPPGQIMAVATGSEPVWHEFQKPEKTAHCLFEFVYFARPYSLIFGRNVYEVRQKSGALLAKASQALHKTLDMVVPFPDSGNYAGLGFCQASGVPLEMGMIRNHYVGRTFIQPTQKMREYSVRIKLNPVAGLMKDKQVAIVDDSVVRGTTGQLRMKFLRNEGLKGLHLLVAAPPVTYHCPYGAGRGRLLADGLNPDDAAKKVKEFMGLDSVIFMPLEDLIKASGFKADQVCAACFNGCFPLAGG